MKHTKEDACIRCAYMLLLDSCGQRASARVSTANTSFPLISSWVMLVHIASGTAVKFKPAQLPWVKHAGGSAAQRLSAVAVHSETGYSDSEQDLQTANNRCYFNNSLRNPADSSIHIHTRITKYTHPPSMKARKLRIVHPYKTEGIAPNVQNRVMTPGQAAVSKYVPLGWLAQVTRPIPGLLVSVSSVMLAGTRSGTFIRTLRLSSLQTQ